jgi:diguanylate cyclase (GGDEF)-like protein
LNRRHFFKLAEQRRAVLLEHQQPATVAMIDIDFFKSINDSYGHQAGDDLLKKVAKTLQECFDQIAIIGRFGGEEFAILLPELNLNLAKETCKDLLLKISNTKLNTGAQLISVTVSIGLSEVYDDDSSIEKALSRADKALYNAKDRGRNTVSVFKGD